MFLRRGIVPRSETRTGGADFCQNLGESRNTIERIIVSKWNIFNENDKQQKHHTGFAQATLFEHGWQPWLYWITFSIDHFQRRDRVIDWKVCLSVCLSVPHHFSLSEYWIIWWFTPCKPYIFWKHITLATSTALFRPSITKYQLVPQYNDPVPSSNNQYRPFLTSISTGKSLAINLTSYECTSGVDFDQGFLSFWFLN